MRQPTTQAARKQPKDPPKAVLHPKKPYVKWKRRRDYKKEEEDYWVPSTFPPHNYARPTFVCSPAPMARPREFDREAHIRAVQAREEAELELQQEAEFQREVERRRRERAQQEQNERNNRNREARLRAVIAHEEAEREQQREAERRRRERAQRERNERNNRPQPNLRCGAQPAAWPAEAPDRVDSAKRTTEKERSLHRVREHQRQLEELENLRVAQLAKMDELRRIGREIGGA